MLRRVRSRQLQRTPKVPLRCGLIECVPTIRAALLRETSHFRAHCPVFWPQMAHERKFKARRLTFGSCCYAMFDAVCTAAALHAIRAVLEARLLPSAMC